MSKVTVEYVNDVVTVVETGIPGPAGPRNIIQESGGPTTLTVGAVADGEFLKRVGSTVVGAAGGGGGGAGTVTSVAATGSTGITVGGSPITTSGTITLTLSANLQSWSAILPADKFDAAGVSAFGATLIDDADASAARTTLGLGTLATQSGTFSGTSSGTNTGDQASVTGNAGTATALATGRTIAITGDLAYTSPSFDGSANVTAAGTLATVNGNVGSFGSATAAVTFTVNAKGLVTAASSATITPAVGSITGLGTGVATALAVNVGSAGAPVVNGGALGTPSSGVATNLTGTAAGLTAGNVTTNANLTGPVTSTGNATAIANGAISNAMLANAAVANLSGTNTGDQSSIVGITGTKAQFDAAVTDGNLAYASDLAGYQPLDGTLTALAALDSTAGLLEQTGADTFTRRPLGVGASTSVPTRADADARYPAIAHESTHIIGGSAPLSGLGSSQLPNATIITESGTTRTMGNSDAGNIIRCTNATSCALTFPDTLTAGKSGAIMRAAGAGAVTWAVSGSMVATPAGTSRAGHVGVDGVGGMITWFVDAANSVIIGGDTA